MLLLESGLTRGLIMEQFKKIIPILVIIAIYGGITTIYYEMTVIFLSDSFRMCLDNRVGIFIGDTKARTGTVPSFGASNHILATFVTILIVP